jgi:hypothetical protein
MTNGSCCLVRSRPAAACNDNAAWVVRPEFGRYPPPDHAIAADDENVLIIQAAAPQNTRRERLERVIRSNPT